MAQQSRSRKSTVSDSSKKAGTGTKKSSSADSSRSRSSSSKRSSGSDKTVKTRTSSGRTSSSRNSSGRTSSRSASGTYGRKTNRRAERNDNINGNLIMIVLLAVMVFIFLADFGIMGPVGNAVSGFLFGIFGLPQYVLPVAAVALGGWYFIAEDRDSVIPRIICCILLLFCVGIVCEMVSADLKSDPIYNAADIYNRCKSGKCGGGILAGSVTFLLYHFLKQAGTILVLILIVLVCAVVLSGKSLSELIEQTRQNGYDIDVRKKQDRYSEKDVDRDTEYDEDYDEDPDESEAEALKYRRIREEERILRKREADEERDRIRREREARERAREREKEEAAAREKEEKRRALEKKAADQNRSESEEILRRAEAYNLTSTALEPVSHNEDPNGPVIKSPADMTGAANTYPEKKEEVNPHTEKTHADTSGNKIVPVSAEQKASESQGTPVSVYSMAGDLHEITVNDADYAPFTAKADIEGPDTQGSTYTGIAIPTPQETQPDYSSDSFSDRIIRQGLEETLHYEEFQRGSGEIHSASEDISITKDESCQQMYGSSDLHEIVFDSQDKRENTQEESISKKEETTGAEMSDAAEYTPAGNLSNSDEQAPAGELFDAEGQEPAGILTDEKEQTAAEESSDAEASICMKEPGNEEEMQMIEDGSADIAVPVKEAGSENSPAPKNNEIKEVIREENDSESSMDDDQLREITVEREHAENPQGKTTVFKDPAASGYRENTSGTVFGGGIAAAQVKRDEEDKKAVKYRAPYVFPTINLLEEGRKTDTGETDRELQETALNLQNTLKTFGVDVTIPQVSQGPAVTRYELLPAEGVKVSKIVSLADDIKLNLAAADIRIEAPIPGKRAIGIEVPNRSPQSVPLRDLFESEIYRQSKANVRFAVGKDIGGNVVVTDITKMPHMLIAGSTGSGKSVCINTLIMSILMTYRPDEVKMIMIDPKIVELSVYNGIPHLLLPVVTDPKKASDSLKWAVAEMTDRFRKFADNSVRDIRGYNEWVQKQNDPELELMPRIVIIVDELADLMMVSAKEVEESICRLAQLARAAGIHLIIATQRPSVDVITGLIKANMPSRIAFAVTSGVDSRTILDMNGAEKLLGKGDMLFYPQGYPKPARIQGAFVSDEEVQKFADFLRYHNRTWCDTGGEVEKKIACMSSGSGEENSTAIDDGNSGSEYDEHFVEAGYLIIDKQKASIGMLQRVYKIGFNRAARIMDQLCEAGVVSAEEGTKARKVLMSSSDFESFIEENGI